jgi:hypothetical protein
VSKLGLRELSSSSSVSTLLRRLYIASSSVLSGGSTVSYEPIVFRMPRQVKNPLGSKRHKNSQISFCRADGDLLESSIPCTSLNISLITGVNLSID